MIDLQFMSGGQIDEVTQIELDSFAVPWSRRDFEQELNNKNAIYIIASEDNKVIGYAGMWHVVNEGHIVNIAVKTEKRRMGVGTMLMKKLIDIALEKEMIGLTLEVRMSNAAGQRLYNKFGFKVEGIRRRYYSDTGEDAIIMWKYL